MAEREVTKVIRAEPKFISYLLNPNVVHDTYFLIGKEKAKIGAVRKMLAAHSVVLRAELEDSQLAEKGDICLEDISTEAFKNLLRYVYGYNNIATLHFDDADDLLYAADKYLIQDLKDQLAVRLMDLLDSQNICSLLNNPACHTVLELDAKITEILRYETNDVFANPEFVNLRVEAVVKILEQNALLTTELAIWKASLKWAKNQACSEDGSIVRKYISQLKHIRIHSITLEDFCTEVVPANVLSDKEVVKICASHKKDEKPRIEGFSEKTDQRILFKHEVLQITTNGTINYSQTSFTITTTFDIILLPFEFIANSAQSSLTDYCCEGIIDVTHKSSSSNSSLNAKRTARFNKKVKCGQIFKVSLPANCKRLLANNSYNISITFNSPHLHHYCYQQSYTCPNFTVCSNTVSTYYLLPFKSLQYIKCLSK